MPPRGLGISAAKGCARIALTTLASEELNVNWLMWPNREKIFREAHANLGLNEYVGPVRSVTAFVNLLCQILEMLAWLLPGGCGEKRDTAVRRLRGYERSEVPTRETLTPRSEFLDRQMCCEERQL